MVLAPVTSAATSTAAPAITASPTTVQPGSAVSVSGTGFQRNSSGYVALDHGSAVVPYRANGKGAFTTALSVPSSVAPGAHALTAGPATSTTLASMTLTIVPATASPAPTVSPVPTASPAPTPTTAPSATPSATVTPTPTATPAPGAYGATDGVVCDGRLSITQGGSTLGLPYCSNRSLVSPSTAVTRAIVVVHGDSRNAPDHLGYVKTAASLAGVTDALIVAPQFVIADDLSTTALRGSTLYWTSSGWKEGNTSTASPYARPWSISSYAALDVLLAMIGNPAVFPNLHEIVVVGHSAGGQLADRYAASTRQPAALAPSGIVVRYIVANPSSYLYFDQNRLHAATGLFAPLSSAERQSCSSYDTYKYGLNGLNNYTSAVGATTLTAQYGQRRVRYLLGALDTDPADSSLDTSCAAEWQGSQRFERGMTHHRYLGIVFGQSVYQTHVTQTVSGVGHDARGIYTSPTGRAAIFATGG